MVCRAVSRDAGSSVDASRTPDSLESLEDISPGDQGTNDTAGEEQKDTSSSQLAAQMHRTVDACRRAMRLDDDAVRNSKHAVCACGGTGTHLGMDIEWSLTFDAADSRNGSYWEGAQGEYMSYRWGYDGSEDVASPQCTWEVDTYGLPISLTFDDKETGLLCAWVRTGYWTRAVQAGRLIVDTSDVGNVRAALLNSDVSSFEGPGSEAVRDSLPKRRSVVSVRLPNGRVTAHVIVDEDTGLASCMQMQVCGEMEAWLFDDWGTCDATGGDDVSLPFPRRTSHVVAGGASMHEFCVDWVRWAMSDDAQDTREFSMPTQSYPPAKTAYAAPPAEVVEDDDVVVAACERGSAWLVDAQRTRSGHVLVRPLIDGRDVGWFILDTGASGLVLEPEAADELDLPGFGEVHVSGVGGKVPSQYRRAKELRLGPLVLSDPLFMEMSVARVVSGTHRPGPVNGILGFDVLQRLAVEVPPASRYRGAQGSGQTPNDLKVALYEPGSFCAPPPDRAVRVTMTMISNVPHVWCEVEAMGGVMPTSPALLMLDSGAGGVEAMFHARAADEMDLFGERAAAIAAASASSGDGDSLASSSSPAAGAASVRGVGGDASSTMTVRRALLPRLRILTDHPNPSVLRLGGDDALSDCDLGDSTVAATVTPVSALVAGTNGALDLSSIGMGLLCGDAIADRRVIFDYAANPPTLWLVDPSCESDSPM